ncbi:MAG: putative DNA binding domain-containing protein [Anaerolineae bacterium]|nr:putative DNA binding domain-containing protein [Anaerolineae bacterium]
MNVEFKSDISSKGDCLADSILYEETVALANSGGGILLVGIEDDGAVTGLNPKRGNKIDEKKLQAAILNNSVPSVPAYVEFVVLDSKRVAAILVRASQQIHATAQGRVLRRSLSGDGKPQTIPFYPHEQRSRLTDVGSLDYSAQMIEGTTFDDLNPLEFERLRQIIGKRNGEQNLLSLSNEDLAKAMRLVESREDRLIPNIAGLLLLGLEQTLVRFIPTHEVFFQVLGDENNVRVNDSFHLPLLHTLNEIEARFAARNEEHEINIGMFRFPVPDYSSEGFREAVNNAVLHRDYTRKGAVYVQWQPDHLLITNPGGFPEGITLDNLLVHEPVPRNPRLAEAFRRVGLVEQTGRGVDKIYEGQLRYGRPVPDYTRSDSSGVRVVLQGGQGSLEFAAFVYEHENVSQRHISLDELMVLNQLFFERRIDSERAGKLIQKGTAQGRAVLEKLFERGLVEARGEKRGRIYHLSATVYQRFQKKAEYVRTKSFAPEQHEQMILNYVKVHHRITRSEAAELCQLGDYQATRLLKKLTEKYPNFNRIGERKTAYYIWEEK